MGRMKDVATTVGGISILVGSCALLLVICWLVSPWVAWALSLVMAYNVGRARPRKPPSWNVEREEGGRPDL